VWVFLFNLNYVKNVDLNKVLFSKIPRGWVINS